MKTSQVFLSVVAVSLAALNTACSAKVDAKTDGPTLPVQKEMVMGTWVTACQKDPNSSIYLRESLVIDKTQVTSQVKIFLNSDCSSLLQESQPMTGTYQVAGESAFVPGALDLDVDSTHPDGSHYTARHLALFEGNNLYLEGTVYDGDTGRPITVDRSKPYIKQ